ncbi:MAG: DUF1564 family protein [Leptospiraceae bacterium]|nr:DUF1564 family protein [Leptospiraceae bacterium]
MVRSSLIASETESQLVSSSTLLIPRHLLDYFTLRVHDFRSVRAYFEYLIVNYGRQLARYKINPASHKWKKKYQNPGLDLQIRNFRPDPRFWEEFRHIAFGYGLAMCNLFVILLELEHRLWLKAKSPAKFHETQPSQPAGHRKSVNSRQNLHFGQKKYILNLLSSNEFAILIRSMDYSDQRLHRMCLIH